MLSKNRIAIIGGGPSGLFMYKRLIESGHNHLEIAIFEASNQLGAGMPYSYAGANAEHITNVSDIELPELVTSIKQWVQTVSKETLHTFSIDPGHFNEYKVLPRLLFGKYLTAQFELLKQKADKLGFVTTVHLCSQVSDIIDHPETKEVVVEVGGNETYFFDKVVVCTGHKWTMKHEGNISGYFDSPYPPAKLALKLNHPVAIRGSSLTAIDAIRTIARHNGAFVKGGDGKLTFQPDAESPDFKVVMHSRSGLLPAIRFHQEDPFLANELLLSKEELEANRVANDGFLSLDYLFEKNFKQQFIHRDPAFYELVKELSIEDFVEAVMNMREERDPFELFQAEYFQAERSIKRRESVYWKETLSALSFSLNYPAKYLSAEDMLRLQKVLMPLISIVIAFVPQSSCEELLALHAAGKLNIVAVGSDSVVEPQNLGGVTYQYTDEKNHPCTVYYKTFIDCIGQPHLPYEAFPFKSLLQQGLICPARIRFRSAQQGKAALEGGNKFVNVGIDGNYYLNVPGITINDYFQVIDLQGKPNERIYIMAVPYMGGYNPDYSGLDFCAEASGIIVNHMQQVETGKTVSGVAS
ncbi:Uncharacterized NAD(P)/FAD-binding protein YdhS [bacterium A37T11]|nr:Uncharacterized NAD(P)/FAD-binding protein YdhS [bacterium A37T11]